jgi:hypothetical protein
LARKVHALINSDVHFLDKDAVSGDSIALLEIDDISYHKFSDLYADASSISPSIDCNHLIVYLVFELKILRFLNPVAGS